MSDTTQRPQVTFTVAEAAVRLKRSTRTIERWITDDGLDVIKVRNDDGKMITVIEEGPLFDMYRAKLTAPRGGKGKPRRKVT